MRYLLLPAVAVTIAIATFALQQSVTGQQLLLNPGFEDGISAWDSIDADISSSTEARSGSGALAFSGTNEASPDVFQWVDVQASATYEASGWIRIQDADVVRGFIRVMWFTAGNGLILQDDSSWVAGSSPDYRFASTGPRIAPLGAVKARVAIVLVASGPFSAIADDISFDGPPPASDTPPATTVGATPTSTDTATAPPSSPTVSAQPSGTPGTATVPPTVAPTPTPTPTPDPVTPRPTPSEPLVFSGITNGGFEQVTQVDEPFGWRKIGGAIAAQSFRARSGIRALSLTSESTSTKWAYQTISIQGGEYYAADAWAWKNDAATEAAFLRISWYESDDGSGEALGTVDSDDALETDEPAFRHLAIRPVQAPPQARTARVRLMLRPVGESLAAVYFDDVNFGPAPAPTPTATLAPTPTVVVTSAAPSPTDSTEPSVTTPGATATATSAPTVTPTASPSPTPVPEPFVFESLTNSGFEIAREDGTAYGWHKNGGEASVTDAVVANGALALQFRSASASTKWVYQNVMIEPGAFYQASVWALDAEPSVSEVLLRVSWYASEDAGGQALGSADSSSIAIDAGAFRFLTTEPLAAPIEARTARIRLLVRPANGSAGSVYFDDVSFSRVPVPAAVAESESPSAVEPPAAASTRPASVLGAAASPRTLASGERTPIQLANVKFAEPDEPASNRDIGGDDHPLWSDLLLASSIVLPLLGFAAIFSFDLSRATRRRVD